MEQEFGEPTEVDLVITGLSFRAARQARNDRQSADTDAHVIGSRDDQHGPLGGRIQLAGQAFLFDLDGLLGGPYPPRSRTRAGRQCR